MKQLSLYLFLIVFSLCTGSCDKNDVNEDSIPPVGFSCQIRKLDEKGNSLFKAHKNLMKAIKVQVLTPQEGVSVNYYYNATGESDFLSVNIGVIRIKERLEKTYKVLIKYPDAFQQKADTLSLDILHKGIEDGCFCEILNAQYNKTSPQSIDNDSNYPISYFTIK